jgi:hypothetical protein
MEPVEPTASPESPTSLDWVAVVSGAVAGLGIVIVAAALHAILDHNVNDLDDSGWVLPLFVLVLLGYGLAGWVAQWTATSRASSGSPLTHGALAGIGVLALWFPIRVIIWIARAEDRGLFTGDDAALRPGQIFGHIVIAAGLGMLGAYVALRVARRGARTPNAGG